MDKVLGSLGVHRLQHRRSFLLRHWGSGKRRWRRRWWQWRRRRGGGRRVLVGSRLPRRVHMPMERTMRAMVWRVTGGKVAGGLGIVLLLSLLITRGSAAQPQGFAADLFTRVSDGKRYRQIMHIGPGSQPGSILVLTRHTAFEVDGR